MKVKVVKLLPLFICLSWMVLNLSLVAAQHVQVTSQVLDGKTNAPVGYASIGLMDSNRGTVTDAEGRFHMTLPPTGPLLLRIGAIGYKPVTLRADQVRDRIFLEPASYNLKEVVVKATSFKPREIVKKAFGAIPKNYHNEPILLETFYRHFCQDDSLYGRIIEATVDIYKKKGYGKRENYGADKDLLRVNELRRSFDNNQRLLTTHAPMAMEMMQDSDIAAYKVKSIFNDKVDDLFDRKQNFVNPENKSFEFELDGITTLDDEEVYEIGFTYDDGKGSGEITYKGRFFISTGNHAILRFESHASKEDSKFDQRVSYKKYGDKYALFHSLVNSHTVGTNNKTHAVHIELMVTNLLKGEQNDIGRPEIDKAYLDSIPYRQEFWNSYPLINKIPVPESLQQDLQAEVGLEQQYQESVQHEAQFALETEKDEQALLKLISENKGILVLDLWAAWYTPYHQEYKLSESNREMLSKKGVRFLMVSVDSDLNLWRKTVELLGMQEENHFKIGPNTKFLRQLVVKSIPRYLVYQGKTLINDNAPKPSSQEFKEVIEQLLIRK